MKRKFSLLIFLTAVFLQASCIAEVVDKVEVVVNDEMITRREIDRLLVPIYEKYQATYDTKTLITKMNEARQKVVEQMIEDKLIYGEAKKAGIKIDERSIDDRIESMVKNTGGRDNFDKMLASQQITIKELRNRYIEQAMSHRFIEYKFGSKVTIAPSEISDYYSKHADKFSQPEEALVRNILIKPGEDPARSAKLAGEILKRLKEGCDFGGLAKIYSEGPAAQEGGLMGYVKRGDLMPQIEDAVFKLKGGEMSGIIKTSVGYHILKVEERRPGKVRSFGEVKREVEEAIFTEKMNSKVKGWVESLKKNAYIEIR